MVRQRNAKSALADGAGVTGVALAMRPDKPPEKRGVVLVTAGLMGDPKLNYVRAELRQDEGGSARQGETIELRWRSRGRDEARHLIRQSSHHPSWLSTRSLTRLVSLDGPPPSSRRSQDWQSRRRRGTLHRSFLAHAVTNFSRRFPSPSSIKRLAAQSTRRRFSSRRLKALSMTPEAPEITEALAFQKAVAGSAHS